MWDGTLGLEKHRIGGRFGPRDIGVSEGPPMRGASFVVETAAKLLDVDAAGLWFFDEATGTVLPKTTFGMPVPKTRIPFSGSILTRVKTQPTVALTDLTQCGVDAPEQRVLEMRSVLATAVFGPEPEPIGAFACFNQTPRHWSVTDLEDVGELAHLITQEIILRASFETMRLMANKRFQVVS